MPHPENIRVLHYLHAVREEDGGVVRAVLDLCSVLAERGCNVILATYDAKDVPADWARRPDAPQLVDLSQSPNAFAAALDECDVVHLHTPWDRHNLSMANEAAQAGKPYVVSVHGMLDDWCMAQKGLKKRVYWWLAARRLLERAYRVHCTAEGERKQAEKWYPRGATAVLPLVVDMPAADELPGPEQAMAEFPALDTDQPKLLFLSRLHPKKGIDQLLRAISRMQDAGKPLQLFIAGPGEKSYAQQLQQMAVQLGVGERTHFVGLVQGSLKLSLYQAADLFVLPTHQENFGLVLPEALACGTPVVTTRGVDIWPEIEAAGGVITSNEPEPLAARLSELLADLPRLAELGEQGRRYIHNWLDPSHVVDGYAELYRQAAAECSIA